MPSTPVSMTSSLHYAEGQFQDALTGPLDPEIAVYLEKAQKAGNRKQFGYTEAAWMHKGFYFEAIESLLYVPVVTRPNII